MGLENLRHRSLCLVENRKLEEAVLGCNSRDYDWEVDGDANLGAVGGVRCGTAEHGNLEVVDSPEADNANLMVEDVSFDRQPVDSIMLEVETDDCRGMDCMMDNCSSTWGSTGRDLDRRDLKWAANFLLF